MSSFLSALTSIAGQYGEAKNQKQQEDLEKAAKFRSMDVQDAYLQLAKQAETRQSTAQEAAIKRGNLIKIGNKLWDVNKNAWADTQQVDPMTSLKSFIQTLPKEVQSGAASRAQMAIEADPSDPKAAIQEVLRYSDAQKTEANRREDAAQRERERREDALKAESNRRDDRRDSRHEIEGFEKQMIDLRLAEKQKYMTPQERQLYDSIKQVEPSVQKTIDFLENTKDSDGKPLMSENSYVFGDRSALMQHLRFRGYKFGEKQEDISQQLIKNAALIQVLGARPWMTMGRGKFIYETIAQHLPSPTDTPSLMHDKLTWLRDNVLEDAKGSLSGYVAPGGASGGEGSESNPIVIQ